MRAVIDRFEGDYAVVLFGEEEIKVDMPKKLLPPDAAEGTWLNVTFAVDRSGTEKQRERIARLLDKLKKRV